MNTIYECAEQLLLVYNIDYKDTWLKRPTKKFKGIQAFNYFLKILDSSSLNEAAIKLDCSARTLQRVLKELNHGETFSEKGGSIKYYLLELLNLKECTNCHMILSSDSFSKNGTNLRSTCRMCCSETFAKYYEEHKGDIIAKVTLRTEHIIKATPKWADKQKIKEIYRNCPEGYHVDHVIPLRGKYVSGLHVESNLQYLSAKENLSKGNTWEVS